jgi:cyclopropane-fatty-acyl-phospholipid synthase
VRSGIYLGHVMHDRTATARHRFRHAVAMYAIDLDEAPELARRTRLFAYERPGVVSLRAADHIGDPTRTIRENVTELLAAHGITIGRGRILMVTNLRTLGYVFNPITCLWCQDETGALRALVAEVSNTFGERHAYVFPADVAEHRGRLLAWDTDKLLHVSPFFGMHQRYRVVAAPPDERLALAISVLEDGKRVLHTTLTGRRRPFTRSELVRAQLAVPLMPQRVTALIHLEALHLFRKGVPVFRKPPFRTGHGTVAPPPDSDVPRRRGLRPPPPARRSPLTPVVDAVARGALRTPAVGAIEVQFPDGQVVRGESGRPGPHPVIRIHSGDLFRRIARRGATGVGEAYVAGDWDADDLPGAVEILLRQANAAAATPRGRLVTALRDHRPRLPERVSMALARSQIGYHYDLGNDLYRLFLDPSLTYSCAVFATPGTSLEDAQLAKHRMICAKLRLAPGDHVLEIGCGWGSFAIVAARDFGARVTGVTLSDEQLALGTERVRAAGLSDRIDLRLQDYRTMDGAFTQIASTEMIEAIGHRELPRYFATIDRLLAPNGIVCIQAIAMTDQRYARYRRSRDWISEYVFPGGNIPSLEAMTRALAGHSRLIVSDIEDIGIHYARTLELWRENFDAARADVLALGFDEEFIRGWRFYLASCEAAFRARSILDYQLVLTRPFNDRLGTTSAAAPADQASIATPRQNAT